MSRRVAVLALGPLLLCGCTTPTPSPSSPEVLAVWRGGEVTRSDLEAHVLSLPEDRRRPAEDQSPEVWRRRQLEDLMVRHALGAAASGVASKPEVVAELERSRGKLLVDTVRQRRIAATVQISEEELRAFYEEHPEDFGHEEQVRLRHIFLRSDRAATPTERDAVRARVEDLLRQIREGAHFGDLARLHSESETARVDGLIGRMSRGTLGPKIEQLVFALEEGEVSEVVPTAVGFHIFKAVNHVPSFRMPFEEARTRLVRRLTRERTAAAMADFRAELIESSGATVAIDRLGDADPEAVLFAAGSERLTLADWRVRLHRQSFPAQRSAPPAELLQNYIFDRLLLLEGEAQGLADEPEVASALAARTSRVLRDAVLRHRLEDELDAVDDGELRALFDSAAQRYQSPSQRHVALLTRSFPDGEQPYRLFEEMQALAARLREGAESFKEAARRLSDDVSAHRGGDVGAIRLDAFLKWGGPDAQKALSQMAPGEVSEPILVERYEMNRLQYARQGYMLIKLIEVIEPQQPSFEAVRSQVREAYLEQHITTLSERARAKLLADSKVYFFEDNL